MPLSLIFKMLIITLSYINHSIKVSFDILRILIQNLLLKKYILLSFSLLRIYFCLLNSIVNNIVFNFLIFEKKKKIWLNTFSISFYI